MKKIFDVYTQKVYEKNGARKIKWYKVGFLKETDKGSRYLRLFNQPETDFLLFEKEPLSELKNGQ